MTEQEQPSFDCVCRKCRVNFISHNKQDLDGDGQCSPCQEKTANIAKQVQKNIEAIRARRGSIPEPPKLKTVPNGLTKINARDLF